MEDVENIAGDPGAWEQYKDAAQKYIDQAVEHATERFGDVDWEELHKHSDNTLTFFMVVGGIGTFIAVVVLLISIGYAVYARCGGGKGSPPLPGLKYNLWSFELVNLGLMVGVFAPFACFACGLLISAGNSNWLLVGMTFSCFLSFGSVTILVFVGAVTLWVLAYRQKSKKTGIYQ